MTVQLSIVHLGYPVNKYGSTNRTPRSSTFLLHSPDAADDLWRKRMSPFMISSVSKAHVGPRLLLGKPMANPRCLVYRLLVCFQISISSSINGSRLCTCIACGHVCHVLCEQMEPNICMHTCVIYINNYLFNYSCIFSFFPRIIFCIYTYIII